MGMKGIIGFMALKQSRSRGVGHARKEDASTRAHTTRPSELHPASVRGAWRRILAKQPLDHALNRQALNRNGTDDDNVSNGEDQIALV